MQYQDEEFAQIERIIRKTEEIQLKVGQQTSEQPDIEQASADKTVPEQEKPEAEKSVDLPTQEEIDEAVEKNFLEMKEKEIVFAQTSFFEERLSFKFPQDFFELKNDSKEYLVYANFEEEINCLLNYIAGDGEIDLQKIKKEILKNFKAARVRSTWLEEGSKRINGKHIGYCVLINHTPDHDVFNYMIFTAVKDGHVIINFNGDKAVFDLWEMLAKALMKTIEVSD